MVHGHNKYLTKSMASPKNTLPGKKNSLVKKFSDKIPVKKRHRGVILRVKNWFNTKKNRGENESGKGI